MRQRRNVPVVTLRSAAEIAVALTMAALVGALIALIEGVV